MLHFKILLHFYKNFAIACISISLIGGVLTNSSESISYTLLFTIGKIISNILIGVLFHAFKSNLLYYYYNLGFSLKSIYALVMLLDLGIYLMILLF
jgi:hypothetical protein